jgi:hypothetical protein
VTEPRVFDCFTFATELELLHFRLDLLAPVVDFFVIVEATRTFSGLPKKLYFDEHKAEFDRHRAKIVHVVVDDLPDPDPDRWVCERAQRDAIARGLSGALDDDIVMVTDVDEIPDPAVVSQLRSSLLGATALQMRSCYFRANWESTTVWCHPRATRVSALSSPQALRETEAQHQVREAGAHFSYLMSGEEIVQKFAWFSHDELDTPAMKSQRYLSTLLCAGVFGPGGDLLVSRAQGELSLVQGAFHRENSEWFSFRPFPPLRVRRAVRRYAHFRRRLRGRTLLLTDSAVEVAVRLTSSGNWRGA